MLSFSHEEVELIQFGWDLDLTSLAVDPGIGTLQLEENTAAYWSEGVLTKISR